MSTSAYITAAFETSETGLNDRAAALGVLSVAEYASPTREGIDAIRAERSAIFNELSVLKRRTSIGHPAAGWGVKPPVRDYDFTGEHAILDNIALIALLERRLAGESADWQVTASIEARVAAAVASFVTLGAGYIAAAVEPSVA